MLTWQGRTETPGNPVNPGDQIILSYVKLVNRSPQDVVDGLQTYVDLRGFSITLEKPNHETDVYHPSNGDRSAMLYIQLTEGSTYEFRCRF